TRWSSGRWATPREPRSRGGGALPLPAVERLRAQSLPLRAQVGPGVRGAVPRRRRGGDRGDGAVGGRARGPAPDGPRRPRGPRRPPLPRVHGRAPAQDARRARQPRILLERALGEGRRSAAGRDLEAGADQLGPALLVEGLHLRALLQVREAPL